jgi:hypothetical protein
MVLEKRSLPVMQLAYHRVSVNVFLLRHSHDSLSMEREKFSSPLNQRVKQVISYNFYAIRVAGNHY